MMLGLFTNHQHPKTRRFRNFRAATQSWCWFSRDSIVTMNLFFGNSEQRYSTASTLPRPIPSPAIRSRGLT